MSKPVSFPKIGFDLLSLQVIWSLWALGIFIFINIVQKIFHVNQDSIYNSGLIASNIYMFVIGIITIAFLTYYVEMGITRKNYFYGNVLASIGLSILIPIMLYIVSLLESLIINGFTSFTLKTGALDEVMTEVITETDGHIIVEIIFSFIFTPYVSLETNFLLSFALFSLNLLVFYIVGWMIGAAFKRTGVIGGILFILLGIVCIAIKDSAMRIAMDIPLFENFLFLEGMPKSLAFPIVFLIILILFTLTRLLTKRAPVNA